MEKRNRKILATVLVAVAVVMIVIVAAVVVRSDNSSAEKTNTTVTTTTLPYAEETVERTDEITIDLTGLTEGDTTEGTTSTTTTKAEDKTTIAKSKTTTTKKPQESKTSAKATTTKKITTKTTTTKKITTKKAEPTTLSAAEKKKQARAFAEKLAADIDGDTDLERVSQAAQIVAYYSSKATYTMEGSDYATAYGVFIKGEYSCAGSTRALGMLLECMGYSWKHVNENQYSHQWVELTMDGQKGWADGQIGMAGYGEYPFA